MHDDVLHSDVHIAIHEFYEDNADYHKVILDYPNSQSTTKPRIVQDKNKWFMKGNRKNNNFLNPVTMYGFKKVH
jgi:hypothetical protein